MTIFFSFLAVYVLLCLLLVWRETSLLYYPDKNIFATPAVVHLPFEDLQLTASDGVKINGWFIPSSDGNGKTVLFFHGNAGNISHRLEKIAILHSLHWNVCIIDYRGFGRSEGLPSEAGTYRDAQAAYDYLTREKHLANNSIILYGESLGTGIAVKLASETPVSLLILEAPYTSIVDIGKKMFPFLPISLLSRNRYDSLSRITKIHSPLLIFHSRTDEVVPFDHSEKLFALANEPKQRVILSGTHNDAFLVSREIYRGALESFAAQIYAKAAK